ncbi:hypothetical protein EJ03DRAFT_325032, partial [Teratosphaeria nubilosa]
MACPHLLFYGIPTSQAFAFTRTAGFAATPKAMMRPAVARSKKRILMICGIITARVDELRLRFYPCFQFRGSGITGSLLVDVLA